MLPHTDERTLLSQFANEIQNCLVLLITDDNQIIGPGYIITPDSIITPSKNLANLEDGIQFQSSRLFNKKIHHIFKQEAYDEFMSVAHVSSYTPIT